MPVRRPPTTQQQTNNNLNSNITIEIYPFYNDVKWGDYQPKTPTTQTFTNTNIVSMEVKDDKMSIVLMKQDYTRENMQTNNLKEAILNNMVWKKKPLLDQMKLYNHDEQFRCDEDEDIDESEFIELLNKAKEGAPIKLALHIASSDDENKQLTVDSKTNNLNNNITIKIYPYCYKENSYDKDELKWGGYALQTPQKKTFTNKNIVSMEVKNDKMSIVLMKQDYTRENMKTNNLKSAILNNMFGDNKPLLDQMELYEKNHQEEEKMYENDFIELLNEAKENVPIKLALRIASSDDVVTLAPSSPQKNSNNDMQEPPPKNTLKYLMCISIDNKSGQDLELNEIEKPLTEKSESGIILQSTDVENNKIYFLVPGSFDWELLGENLFSFSLGKVLWKKPLPETQQIFVEFLNENGEQYFKEGNLTLSQTQAQPYNKSRGDVYNNITLSLSLDDEEPNSSLDRSDQSDHTAKDTLPRLVYTAYFVCRYKKTLGGIVTIFAVIVGLRYLFKRNMPNHYNRLMLVFFSTEKKSK